MIDFKIGDDWFARCRLSNNLGNLETYIAWAAQTTKLGHGPLDIQEAVEVRFCFGDTAEEAMNLLRKEILS